MGGEELTGNELSFAVAMMTITTMICKDNRRRMSCVSFMQAKIKILHLGYQVSLWRLVLQDTDVGQEVFGILEAGAMVLANLRRK